MPRIKKVVDVSHLTELSHHFNEGVALGFFKAVKTIKPHIEQDELRDLLKFNTGYEEDELDYWLERFANLFKPEEDNNGYD